MGPAAGNVEGLQKAGSSGSGELSGEIIHESNLLIFIRGYQQKLPSYVFFFFSGSQVDEHVFLGDVFSLVFCFYKLRYHGIHHRIIWNSTFWNFFPPHLKQLGPWWSLSSPFRIGLDWTPKWPNSMGWSSKYQTWMSLSPFFVEGWNSTVSPYQRGLKCWDS